MIVRRAALLSGGLALYGFSLALMFAARLGAPSWDVFHQGVAERTGLSIGTTLVVTSFVVLLLWIPLRVRPGVGTIANAVFVGLGLELFLSLLPDINGWPARAAMLIAGVVLNGVATGMYIGAGLGAGPRDGLMTGIASRGHSIRVVRTAIEATVLVVGILLGGTFGIGTIAYALAIGPLAHIFIPRFTAMVGTAQPALAH